MSEYKLIISNHDGDAVNLYDDETIRLTSVDGVGSEVNLQMSEYLGDGAVYIGGKMPSRTISIVCGYRKNGKAEKAKNKLYNLCRIREELTVRLVSPSKDVYIKGYCSNISTPPNQNPLVTQIAIVCPDPYFKSISGGFVQMYGASDCWEWINNGTEFNAVELGNTKNAAITTIEYGGETETGFEISVHCHGSCDGFRLKNIKNGSLLGFDTSMKADDLFKISTKKGYKTAYIERNGVIIDCMKDMVEGSSFLQLSPGENKLKITVGADAQFVSVFCKFDELFGGF